MADWPIMSLRDAGVVLIDCVHSTPSARETGHPYVAIPDMKAGRIDFTNARRISAADLKEWTKKASPAPNDVVLSRRTNPGVTAVVTEECGFALGQNLVLLRADGHSVLPEFLRWLVSGPLWWEQIGKFLNVGAVFDSLKCADVPRFELPIPPINKQSGIASVLGALDDKIDLNRRMNETLEAMARAIFRDWFVEFGPTRAKMEGRSPYLAPDLWALFPDRLDDEGKPEGWENTSLWKYASLNPENWTRDNTPSKIVYVDLSSTKWGYIESTETFARGTAPSRAQRVLRTGDTIIGTVRPGNGSFALVGQDGMTGSTGFAVMRPKHEFCREFIYLAATEKNNVERLAILADGGAYPAVRPDAVINTATVEINVNILEKFSQMTSPLLDGHIHNETESRSLAATRGLLLPRLMSGELRIRDAEKIAQDAA